MPFTIYIIQSLVNERYYVGQTENLLKRIDEHNSGKSPSTSHGKPWQIIFQETFPTRSSAMQFESKIKKRDIKRFLLDRIRTG
jgi:putative endonuclease